MPKLDIIYTHFEKKPMLKEIEPPWVCPSCSGELAWRNDLLYCESLNCAEKIQKVIYNFAQKLKIVGLGPASIIKLDISSIDDLYQLTRNDIEEKLSSKALGDKLFTQIEKSKNADLQTLLPAFSIPLFGKTAAEKLCNHVESVHDITQSSCEAAGLGPKTIHNLLEWKNSMDFANTVWDWKVRHKSLGKTGELVVITGKLSTYKNKEQAKGVLQGHGYMVRERVTKDTKYLINESGVASAKTQRAEAAGIKIVTNLKDFLEKKHGST